MCPAAGPAVKLILFALADEADDDGICYWTDQLIAARCEVTNKSFAKRSGFYPQQKS